eukprot:CAMPEP_0172504096 /NCGR_PEP_ID=MMETSP1066-20121228/175337_1 /TAXON_ID=671091 /ORGANISM="Coscinodiscus wailesii, Strain CCMP2513" /LENGTH=289 /DNA_ID=CAMNT_0013280109 /DNA_START=34 /DNA_END=900 /DNA_ORIENTATION=-
MTFPLTKRISSTKIEALSEASLTTTKVSSSFLLGMDLSAQVPDAIRIAVLGIVAITVIVSATSVYVTQSVVPGQLEKLAMLVEQENPERYAEIQSKLAEGEKLTDRPDLIGQLAEAGITMMMEEDEGELELLLATVKEKKEKGDDLEILRESLEAAFGMSVEEYIAKVDKNFSSQYLTKSGKELANILRDEFAKGENMSDRPDSAGDLDENRVTKVTEEEEGTFQLLLSMVKKKKEEGGDLESLREPLEAALRTSVEDYITKVDTLSSQYLSESGKELADILRHEFAKD